MDILKITEDVYGDEITVTFCKQKVQKNTSIYS